MKFLDLKSLVAASALSAAALSMSSPAFAVPVNFAPDGSFATFNFGVGRFETTTLGMALGDTWTFEQTFVNAVGTGTREFESLVGSVATLSPLTLTFATGFANAGFAFSIAYDRTGISDPVGPAGIETGTLMFTLSEMTKAEVGISAPGSNLNSFELDGIGEVTSADGFYTSPQPFSVIMAGTIANDDDIGSLSMTFSSPPDPTVTVSEPATLVLFGAGILGIGFFARRRRTAAL